MNSDYEESGGPNCGLRRLEPNLWSLSQDAGRRACDGDHAGRRVGQHRFGTDGSHPQPCTAIRRQTHYHPSFRHRGRYAAANSARYRANNFTM